MDDADIVMNVAKRFLEHAHIRVMTACNGAEAVVYTKNMPMIFLWCCSI